MNKAESYPELDRVMFWAMTRGSSRRATELLVPETGMDEVQVRLDDRDGQEIAQIVLTAPLGEERIPFIESGIISVIDGKEPIESMS